MQDELLAGRYRLVELVGRGGMGEVWRAHDTVLARDVAVKLTLPVATVGAEATQRFRQEAQAAARLSHPNVVAVHDFGELSDRLFLVLELVGGGSLADTTRAGEPVTPGYAAHVGAQAARGLAIAHAEGVVHRDVKPGNLLLTQPTEDGTVKVTDFGIARMADGAAHGLTQTGAVIGTGTYMAPEQAEGYPAGPASDLYSLGCVLYEMLVGAPPFEGENPAQLLYQHLHEQPVRPSERRGGVGGVPPELERVILQLLAKDPQQRPNHATTVAESLSPMAGGTTPDDPGGGATARLGRTAVLPAARSGTGGRRPRHQVLLASAAGVLVLFLAVMLVARGVGGPTGTEPSVARDGRDERAAGGTQAAPGQTPGQTRPAADPTTPAPGRDGNGDGDGPAGTALSDDPERLLRALDEQVRRQVREGQLAGKEAEKLREEVADTLERLRRGDPEDAGEKLDDLREQLQEVREQGRQVGTDVESLLDRISERLPDD